MHPGAIAAIVVVATLLVLVLAIVVFRRLKLRPPTAQSACAANEGTRRRANSASNQSNGASGRHAAVHLTVHDNAANQARVRAAWAPAASDQPSGNNNITRRGLVREDAVALTHVRPFSSTQARDTPHPIAVAPVQSLDERLAHMGLKTVPTATDGSCQFDAVLKQFRQLEIHGGVKNTMQIRMRAVKWLRENALMAIPLGDGETSSTIKGNDSDTEWATYLNSMLGHGCWGDERTLTAISHAYDVDILVIAADPHYDRTFSLPSTSGMLIIGYVNWNHYVSTTAL